MPSLLAAGRLPGSRNGALPPADPGRARALPHRPGSDCHQHPAACAHYAHCHRRASLHRQPDLPGRPDHPGRHAGQPWRGAGQAVAGAEQRHLQLGCQLPPGAALRAGAGRQQRAGALPGALRAPRQPSASCSPPPPRPGVYQSAWQAVDPAGERFGDPIYIQIVVQSNP